MLIGKHWFTTAPKLPAFAENELLWHIYSERYGPLAANPASKARLALPGQRAMFYLASSLDGALWETVLRGVVPDADRHVAILERDLVGMRAIQVRRKVVNAPLLDLSGAGLRMIFLQGSKESVAVAALIAEPDHLKTHKAAERLFKSFKKAGVSEMPILSWVSRQHKGAIVYLAYEPPMDSTWWETVGAPIALDDPGAGHDAIRQALASSNYHWAPAVTTATVPGPSV